MKKKRKDNHIIQQKEPVQQAQQATQSSKVAPIRGA